MSYGGYGPGGRDPFADAGNGGYGAPGFPPPGQGYPGQGYPGQGYPAQPGHQGGPGYGQHQAPYGAPGQPGPYGGGPQEPENDNRLFGLLAIAFGLLGFVLTFVFVIYILGAVLAAIGVIFGFASLAKEPRSKGFAITGLVAGFGGLAVALVQMITSLLFTR